MHYLYVLKSVSKQRLYIGYSSNLRKRVLAHNGGSVASTKNFRPWQLIYYEAYSNESFAKDRERKLKQRGKAWQALKQRIS